MLLHPQATSMDHGGLTIAIKNEHRRATFSFESTISENIKIVDQYMSQNFLHETSKTLQTLIKL